MERTLHIQRKMNLSLALHVLTLTLSTVAAFSPSPSRASSTRLFYIDESTKATNPIDVDVDVDIGIPVKQVVIHGHNDDDKLWMESLTFSLGLDENLLHKRYHDWTARHNKTMTLFRFHQWKVCEILRRCCC
jgi:hypothetical protein